MSRDDALRQRFRKRVDRIALVQLAEWRRYGQWARADPADGVALRAVEPEPAAGRADGYLGVEDVFAIFDL